MSCACAIHLAVLARSDYMMCSACCEVSVGAVRAGDVSDLTEFLEAPFGLLSS